MHIGIFTNVTRAGAGGGLLWTASVAAALARRHAVDLYVPETADREDLLRFLPDFGPLPNPRPEPRVPRTWLVGEIWRAVRDLRYDAIVVQSPWVPPLALSGRAFLLCEFPFTESPALDDRIRLRSFRQILAVSHYTATWIQRRWGRRAVVLYPPVKPVAQERKGPCILGVGRFVGGGRSKRQRELVAMFRRMCEAGLRGWELHLAGFVQDRAYADQVVADAAGLPVRLHFDVGRPELERLYGMSTLFWHAVGLGADVEREPQRMEHFGIVTVEAMSAGCVPVVIDRGGQREIVGSPRAGVLWNSLDECVDATWRLIRDEAGRDAMSRAAMDRARMFGFDGFVNDVHRVFDGRTGAAA